MINSEVVKCPASHIKVIKNMTAAFSAALFFLTALLWPFYVFAAPPRAGSLPEKHTLRPISKFKVLLPYSDISKIFEKNKMVMIDYDELEELVEKNNKMINDRYPGGKKDEKKQPPSDYIINSASYKFVKDHDNVLCALDIDLSVLAENKYVLIPLIGGSLALNDAVIDDTIPVIISEPLQPSRDGALNTGQQIQQAIEYQSNNMNAAPVVQTYDSNYSAPAALSNSGRSYGRGAAASSRYSLLVAGRGAHTLSMRFLLTPSKDGARYSFSVITPDSPKNNVLFMYDGADAVIRMSPAIGERLFIHPDTKKQAFEADFGFSDRIDFIFYAVGPEEKKAAADSAMAPPPDGALETGEVTASPDGETAAETGAETGEAAPVKYEAEPAAVGCNIKSIYSIGDGLVRGSHDITFNIIKGQLSKFSLEMPIDTDIDEVLTDNYDRRQIRQVRTVNGASDYSSVEVFLKYPVTTEFNLTVTTITKIDEATDEINMPELLFHSVESERGHIAVCALTNVKIGLAREPFNLERIDAQELPDRIKFSVVSPILFAFKYYKHPYRARLKLTKYSDSEVLASVLTSSSVNTFITSQGRAVSSCEYHIKNNGMPFLKLMPDDTIEILDGAVVNDKLVKVSYDQDYNFKIPIVKSSYVNNDILQYPIKFKTSAETQKLSMFGGFALKLPRTEVPSMHLKWRVYTADGYVFYNMRGDPDLKQSPAVPLIYQIPLNFINALVYIYKSPHSLSLLIIVSALLLIAFMVYIIYMGGEKVYEMGFFGAAWNFIYNLFAKIFGFLINHAVSIIFLVMVLLILAAISVPNFNRARHQAKSKSCASNMITIDGAVELYMMENGPIEGIDVYTLQRAGYIKAEPRCPDGYSYNIKVGKAAGGMSDVICPKHGALSMQDRGDKVKGEGYSAKETSRRDYDYATPPSSAGAPVPMPQSINENVMLESKSEAFDEEIEYDTLAKGGKSQKSRPASKVESKRKTAAAERMRSASQARPESRGIFSVPVALPKTGHSSLVEKRFVMSGEEVSLKMSYMSVKLYRVLLALLVFMGVLIPLAASRALYSSDRAPLYIFSILALLFALEAANRVIPDTAKASQLGILAGIIIFALSKTIAKLSNPRVLARLTDMLKTPVTFSAPQPPPSPSSSGPSAPSPASAPSSPAAPGGPAASSPAEAPASDSGAGDKKPGGGGSDNNGSGKGQGKGPGSGGSPKVNLIIFISFIMFSVLLAAPFSGVTAAFAAGANEGEVVEFSYNPATLEVQTFYMLDMAMRSNDKKVMIPYSELKYLIDSVNSMEYLPDSKELTAPAAPPYRAMIKKASLTGDIKLDAAELTLEYFIDVFDENYSAVELIGGSIALTGVESYLIKPYSFGFYGMSDGYIDKLERAYKTKSDRDKIGRYRQARAFETVGRYDNFKINPASRKYSALFEDAGEYMVKISFKTNVIFSDNSYHFDLYPAKSACMKVSLATPGEYDLIADNMIVESRSKEGAGSAARNITAGGLIPADYYSFRLTLAEQARRDRERARLEEERRIKEARERLLAQKSEEVTVITKKIEPRVTLVSACRLTVDEERFSGLVDWNYIVQNTEIRELVFEIPKNTMITLVEGPGVYDWKVSGGDGPGSAEGVSTGGGINGGGNGKNIDGGGSSASSAEVSAAPRELKVMFKNPMRGRIALKTGFETEIFNMKAPVRVPFMRPTGADEYKGFLAIDAAVNAEVNATNEVETNLAAIDEKEIPELPAGYASSSVLFAYKFSKKPDNLYLEIKKHIDIAAIACAIDIASYKTFVTREGYLITSAYYEIRNNNVQFLELKLPAGSEPWSLKVGERLFKPGAGADGLIYIPLLKSPDDGQNFMPFAVSLVYFTKAPAYSLFGGGRIELPRPGVLCSKVDWELHFIDDYNMFNIGTNLRKEELKSASAFMEKTSSARRSTVSIDQMLNIQYKKMAVTNARGASNEMPTQSYTGASYGSGGAMAKSKMPVSISVPSTANLHYFTAESLEKVSNIDDSTIFYVKYSYYSKPVYDALVLIGYLLGTALVLLFLTALFKTGSYRPVIITLIISAVYVSLLEYITAGTVEYFMFGFVMAALLYAAHLIVRLNEEERRFLKLK
jgi:competence protein ComGC